jgi:hypothetical protein
VAKIKLPTSVALQENGKLIIVNKKSGFKKIHQLTSDFWWDDDERVPLKFRSSNDGRHIWAFFLQGSNRNSYLMACVVRNGILDNSAWMRGNYPAGAGKFWKQFWVDDEGNLCLFTTNIKKGDTKVPDLMISPNHKIVPSRDVKIDYESLISIADQQWQASPHSHIQNGREYRLKFSHESPFGSSENVWNSDELPWYESIEKIRRNEESRDAELNNPYCRRTGHLNEPLPDFLESVEYEGEIIEMDPREVTSWEESEKYYDN